MKHSYHFFIGLLTLLVCFSACRNDDETTELNNQLNLNAYITFTNVKGIYEKGVPLDETNYIELHLYALEGGNYNFSSKNTNGYQFKGSGTIESEGDHVIELYGEGTPEVKQVDSVRMETDSTSKTVAITVSENLTNRVILTSATVQGSDSEYTTMAINGRGEVLWELAGRTTENYVNDGIAYIYIEDQLKAVDLISGDILWEKPYQTTINHILEANGKLYVATWSDAFYTLESSTGAVLTEYPAPTSNLSHTILNGDNIILSTNSKLISIDPTTDSVLWESPEYINYGRPSIVGDKIICSSNGVKAFDLHDGTLVWENDINTSGSVAFDGMNVLVKGTYNIVYKIDQETGNTIWEGALADIIHSPELYENYVMVANETALDVIHCFDMNTGEELWDSRPYGFALSELIAHDNLVFLGTGASLYGFSVETGNTEVLIGDIQNQQDPLIRRYKYLLSVTNIDNMNTAYPTSIAPN